MKYFILWLTAFLFLFPCTLGSDEARLKDLDEYFSSQSLASYGELLSLTKFFVAQSPMEEGRRDVDTDIIDPKFVPFSEEYAIQHNNVIEVFFTFKTGFFLDERLKGKFLSLYIGLTDAARIVYLNGVEIGFAGTIDKDPIRMSPHSYDCVELGLSRDLLRYGTDRNELAIQFFTTNDFERPQELVIGAAPTITWIVFLRNLIERHLVQGTFLLSVVLCIYFIFLFLTRKSKEMSYLYFGLLCLAYALSNANLAFANDSIGQYVTEMISRVFYPFTILFLSYFIMEFTGIFAKSKIAKIIVGIPSIALSLYILMQKSMIPLAAAFNAALMYYILPGLVFNTVLLLITIFRKKDMKAAVIFCAYLAVFLVSAHDMYYVLNADIPYTYLLPFGFLALIMSIFFILAYDQSRIFQKSVAQAVDLNEKNKSLTGILENITTVSASLSDSSARLRGVLSDSEGVIEQYEASNRKIGSDLGLKFSEVEELLKNITSMIDISSEKVPQAISSQTAIVKKTSSTLTGMSAYLESNIGSVAESSEAARRLSELAERSTEVIKRSKLSIIAIKEHSRFLQDVLGAIEEISEKTGVLSINAAIEAARQGVNGRGFAIIANEIRMLSNKSKTTVMESLSKVQAMFGIVDESTMLADEVESSLAIIFEKIGETAKMIENITNLIENQRRNSAETAGEVEKLLRDTLMIEFLMQHEEMESTKIRQSLSDLKTTFLSINDALSEQSQKGIELVKYIAMIHEITNQNLVNVAMLKSSI